MNALTLYAGAGGADLGLLAAGIEHVACVDADADCVATLLAAGLPGVRAGIGGPWAGAPALDLSPYVGVDIVWASPPCQPYSRAGKGLGADDPRDGWPHTLDAVRLVRPRWVVVENVSGAPVEKWTADLRELGYTVSAWTLDAADYGVSQNRVREFLVAGPVAVPTPRPTHSLYALAEAKWRTGAYWHRHGIAPVGEPTRKEERALGRLLDPGRGLLPWRTMRDALPGLVDVSVSQTRSDGQLSPTADEPIYTIGGGGNDVVRPMFIGGGTNPRFPGDTRTERDLTDWPSTAAPEVVFAVDPRHPLNDPARPAGTIRSGGSGHGAPPVYITTSREGRERIEYPLRNTPESVRGPSDLVRRHMLQSPDQPATTLATASPMYLRDEAVTRRASEPDRLDRPAPTVATTEEKGTRAHGNPPDFNGGPDRASDAAWLAVGRRRLTVEECATLQDFPADHPFTGTKTSRYRAVGNAVCPRVAEVIARAVLAADATLHAEAAK